jgi:hypothetical protein
LLELLTLPVVERLVDLMSIVLIGRMTRDNDDRGDDGMVARLQHCCSVMLQHHSVHK